MKRMLIAVAALGLSVGAARADWGGPAAPAGGAMPAGPVGAPNTLFAPTAPMNGVAPDPYGLHPGLKKIFRLGATSPKSQYYPQMGYTQNGPGYNPTGYPPGAYGPAQGTLVFPHHPFIRSPRDFFMLDVKK